MGLLNIFNKKRKNNAIKNYETISEWLDDVLKVELPSKIKAINFNLYDDGDYKWSIELIGSSYFDEEDPDWPCKEIYTTRDNPFVVIKDDSWENIEKMFSHKIKEYLNNGKYSNKLKQYEAIGIGFVDGDVSIVYRKN